MFVYRGIRMYSTRETGMTPEQAIRVDPQMSWLRLPLIGLWTTTAVPKRDFYDLYLKTYTDPPKEWAEEWAKRHGGKYPDAVWCYDQLETGEPVFFEDIFYRFGKEAVIAILNGESVYVGGEIASNRGGIEAEVV